jgi:exodeoxyribonuclease V alpha subunit
VALEKVHRFTDPGYAALSLRMRTGDDPAAVFDALHRRGLVVVHPSDSERTVRLAEAGAAGDLVVADTREHVVSLNAAISDAPTPRRATRPIRW